MLYTRCFQWSGNSLDVQTRDHEDERALRTSRLALVHLLRLHANAHNDYSRSTLPQVSSFLLLANQIAK